MQGGSTALTPALAPDGLSLWSTCCTTSQNLLKEHRGHDHDDAHPSLTPRSTHRGDLILIFPRFLNYFIAIYLIVTGLIGLGALRYIGGP